MNNDGTNKPTSQPASKPTGTETVGANGTNVQRNDRTANENPQPTRGTKQTPNGTQGSPERDPAKHASATRQHELVNGKRRPRPAGSVDHSATRTASGTASKEKQRPQAKIEVEAPEDVNAPQKKADKKKQTKAQTVPVDGSGAAKGLLEMVELFSVAKFGPDAAFSIEERFFIEEPLARLIERYGAVAEHFSAIVDPAMVIIGATLYGVRLSSLLTKKKEPEPPKPGEVNPEPVVEVGSPVPSAPFDYHTAMRGVR